MFSEVRDRPSLTASELTRALAEANGFELSYLTENSKGKLAQGQLSVLFSPLIISLVFVLVPAGFLFYQLSQQGFLKQFSMGIPLGEIIGAMPQGLKIIGALLLLVAVMGIYYAVITLLDLAGGSVQIREGRGTRKMTTSEDDDGSTTTRTYYVVDGQKFTVSKKGFRVLENGRNYRVYFTPRRKILVNIEAVD